MNAPVPKMTIVRHPDAHRQQQQRQPSPVKRAAAPGPSVAARLEELQERIYQEQNVIMQTSNALNQCCGSNSSFAGSQEAVECHKLLLISSESRPRPPRSSTPTRRQPGGRRVSQAAPYLQWVPPHSAPPPPPTVSQEAVECHKLLLISSGSRPTPLLHPHPPAARRPSSVTNCSSSPVSPG